MGSGAARKDRPAAFPVNRVDESFLALLRCPRTGTELRVAQAGELAGHNESIRDGNLSNAAGQKLGQAMEGALVSACGRWLYPVHGGIPVLLAEEAVPLGEPCG